MISLSLGRRSPARYVFLESGAHDLVAALGGPASVLDVIAAGDFTLTRLDGVAVGPVPLGTGSRLRLQFKNLTIAGAGASALVGREMT